MIPCEKEYPFPSVPTGLAYRAGSSLCSRYGRWSRCPLKSSQARTPPHAPLRQPDPRNNAHEPESPAAADQEAVMEPVDNGIKVFLGEDDPGGTALSENLAGVRVDEYLVELRLAAVFRFEIDADSVLTTCRARSRSIGCLTAITVSSHARRRAGPLRRTGRMVSSLSTRSCSHSRTAGHARRAGETLRARAQSSEMFSVQ